MDDKLFSTLWAEALTTSDRDAYISDWSLSSAWGDDPEVDIPQDRIEYLSRLWDAAHMSVKDICKAAGLTQTALAQHLLIPQRTFSDWCRGIAKCPDYLRLLMLEHLGLFRR